MITTEHLDTVLGGGGNVVSQHGDKIGGIGQIYLDDETGQPAWVTAKTGLFGSSESFVPLENASVRGEDIVVPYTKDVVKDAPRVEEDGHIEPSEEDQLFEYYQLTGKQDTPNLTTGAEIDLETGTRPALNPGADAGDDTMVRSEEQLRVGTEQHESGRVRLRKYVVTDHVTKTVPIQREEVRLERVPISGDDAGNAAGAGEIGEDVQEVVLHEERPVVEKETVPVERVSVGKDTVTEEHTVTEEVRKEQIDVDGADEARR